jgi:acyl transferase domain-containing protein
VADIAIIGMSGRFPGAPDLHAFWKNLWDGKESISFLTDSQLRSAGVSDEDLKNPSYIKASPVLSDISMFDAEFFGFSRREAELLDPQQRLLLECSWEALESAGYAPGIHDASVGVFVGGGGVVSSYFLNCLERFPEIRNSTGSMQHLANDKDFLATRLSYKLNLNGPSMSIQSACSTSLVAVHVAVQSIVSGDCDMAIAGAANVRVPHCAGYLFQEGGIFSADGHCRPFDASGSGVVFGSGAGIVVLKLLESAIRDNDNIRAVIKGSAVNNDGGSKLSFSASGVTGQYRCISEAIAISQVSPSTIEYVEAFAGGSLLGDAIEVAALTKAFGKYSNVKNHCAIGSLKGNIGHLDVASGIASLIKVVMSLEAKKIPATINILSPNPKIDFRNSPFYLAMEPKDWTAGVQPRRAGINGIGMGGTNAFLVVEEAPR